MDIHTESIALLLVQTVKSSQVGAMTILSDYGVLTTGATQMILVGHTHKFEGVKSVAFSPDGKTLASGGGDNAIHLWDVRTGKSKMTLIGHTHWVFSLAFSSDGKNPRKWERRQRHPPMGSTHR